MAFASASVPAKGYGGAPGKRQEQNSQVFGRFDVYAGVLRWRDGAAVVSAKDFFNRRHQIITGTRPL
jgi:hypothetical protein